MPALAQRDRERRRLDELRPVPDDGEDLHRPGYDYAAALGPLAQLVEQGTLNPKVEGSIPSRPTPLCVALTRACAATLTSSSRFAGRSPVDVLCNCREPRAHCDDHWVGGGLA